VVADRNQKGNAAELAIAAEAARLNLSVLKPLTEHERYDLVLGIAGRLLRVQCKWGGSDGDVIQVQLTSSYHSPTRGYVRKIYAPDEVDAIAVYCDATRKCYLLPIEIIDGRGRLTLRLVPARNNQRAALNYAAAYEFPGAVAQLEERLAGSEEVRGSSPLSSTSTEDQPIVVGSNPLRDRFGYWMQRVAAGEHIVVTHRGRPRIRLSPATAPRSRLPQPQIPQPQPPQTAAFPQPP
jgi:antitoxin (DNA-binding transcriptional repressor) of toxin-antitoxin stability system